MTAKKHKYPEQKSEFAKFLVPPPKAGVIPAEYEERIDVDRPDIYPADMIARHKARYNWAMNAVWARFGRSGYTLDAACGTGYGSKDLLQSSAKVIGLDGDKDAVAHARGRFGGSLLTFREADFAAPLPVNSGQFDAAVTIETIEHLSEADAGFFLAELKRALAPNGLLLLSTPEFNAERGLTSTFHIKEYMPNEMIALVTAAGFVDVIVEKFDRSIVEAYGRGHFIFLRARKPE